MNGPHFNGPDYDPSLDHARLTIQIERIRTLMIDGAWRTLAEIEVMTGDPPASISAQLRHLRKERFGSWVVEKQRRGDPADGLYEYRLLPPDPNRPAQQPGNRGTIDGPSQQDFYVAAQWLSHLVSDYEEQLPDAVYDVLEWLEDRS